MFVFYSFFSLTEYCLAAAMALSLLLTIRLGLTLAVGRPQSPRAVDAFGVTVASISLSLLTIDGASWVDRGGRFLPGPIAGILVMIATVAGGWIYLRLAIQPLAAGPLRRSPWAWGALGALLAACG